MVREKIKELALRREIQVLVVFGILVTGGYYLWLKNKTSKADTEAATK